MYKAIFLGALTALTLGVSAVKADEAAATSTGMSGKDPLTYWLGAGAVFFEADDPNYSNGLYEARIGYDLDPSWTVEFGLGGAPFLEDRDYPAPSTKEGTFNGVNSTGDNWLLKSNISALYHLDSSPDKQWDPYLSVIGGTHFFGKRREKSSNWEEFGGVGAGVAYWFDKDMALRLDYDVVLVDSGNSDINQHVLAMAYYNFGAEETAAATEPSNNEMGAKTTGPLSPVYYDFDKSNLTKNAQDTLKKNAEWMKANNGKKVSLEGHTDERGTNEYNMALGMRRAKSAEKYLKTLGVDKNQMSTTSYGEEFPADPGHNEAAWSKNRRTESVVK